jgi:hypothetical protein
LSEHSLAPYGNRVIRTPEDPRRAAIKRTLSWTLVVLVHLLFFGMFTFNFLQDHEKLGQRNAIETFFDLSLLKNPDAPRISMIKPDVVAPAPPEISTAPVMIPPLKQIPEPPPAPAPAAPGDVLKSIGEALACGAENFEFLTQAQRARCRHAPWLARQLPNGNIVMDLPPKPVEQPEFHMTGADAQRRELEAPRPCPLMLQVPCVDDIINGRHQAGQ